MQVSSSPHPISSSAHLSDQSLNSLVSPSVPQKLGTATQGVPQLQTLEKPITPASNQLWRTKQDHSCSLDLWTLLSGQVLAPAQILLLSPIAGETCLLCSAADAVPMAGVGRWPAFLSAPLPPRCMVLLRLTLNASHTVRAMAAMTAGTSHYHYLWFLNTACYKNCLKHRGRRLHYCIIAHVLKPDFLLHFQPGQFSLKNWVSNLLGFNIGIFSPLCPFLVILYNNISDFTSFSMECIIQTSLPRPLAFHYQSPSTATKVPVSCTILFSHSAAS